MKNFHNEQAFASTHSAGGEALLRGGYASHMWLLSDYKENGTTKFPKVFFFFFQFYNVIRKKIEAKFTPNLL